MRRLLIGLSSAAIFAAGCVTTEITTSGQIIPPPPGVTAPRGGSGSQTSIVVASLCTPSFDGFTLPLLSPNGRFLALQTGAAPPWPTLLALAGATRPGASGIEVWELGPRDGAKVSQLGRGFVLGRSVDASGFLVEEPRPDGSRRIGRVAWPGSTRLRSDGELETIDDARPQWLVDDGRINAFAALGPDGRLAWSVRSLDGGPMGLAVRTPETSFEIQPDDEWNWLLPTFSPDGRTLFALRTRDGVADLVAGDPSDEETFRQSLTIRRLSLRCDDQRAWQAMAPQTGLSATAPGPERILRLYHPDLRRVVEWDPFTDELRPLAEDSFAADSDTHKTLLLGDSEGVTAIQPAMGRAKPPRVFDRPAVPRRVDGEPGTWILLVPERDRLAVTRLRVGFAGVS